MTESTEAKEAVVSVENKMGEGRTPYARLLHHGAECLSDAELVELLFHRRTSEAEQGCAAIPRAATLLAETGGVTGLLNADLQSLLYQELPEPEAVLLLVAAELARRQARADLPEEVMKDSTALARYLFLRFCADEQEVFGVLFLDGSGRLMGEAEVFRGSPTIAWAEPRPLLRQALIRHAAQIVLFHIQPGADPVPSRAELEVTRRVREACELMGIRLLDHLLLGREASWFSLMSYSEGQIKAVMKALDEFQGILMGVAESTGREQATP